MTIQIEPYQIAIKMGIIFNSYQYNIDTSELINTIISEIVMSKNKIEPTNRHPYYVWNDLNDIECRCIDSYKQGKEQPIGYSIGNYNTGYMKWFKYASINHPLEINI